MTENAIVRSRGERPEPRLTRRRFLVGIGGAIGGVAGWVITAMIVLGNAGELDQSTLAVIRGGQRARPVLDPPL
jgi:hypothetical protein